MVSAWLVVIFLFVLGRCIVPFVVFKNIIAVALPLYDLLKLDHCWPREPELIR